MDQTEMDDRLINFLNTLHPALKDAHIYFTHISKSLAIPQIANAKYVDAPKDEKLIEEMTAKVNKLFNDDGLEVDFNVIEGSTTQQILHWANVKNCDLIILGKKDPEKGSSISAKRILRHAESSVVLVPEGSFNVPTKFVVPVDFSGYSQDALQLALDFAYQLSPSASVTVLHVYDVPYELQARTIHSSHFIEEHARQNAEDTYPGFVENLNTHDIPLTPVFVQNAQYNVAYHICEYAEKHGADMVVLGAMGHSAISSFLVGSTTEKVASTLEGIPFLVVRPEEE